MVIARAISWVARIALAWFMGWVGVLLYDARSERFAWWWYRAIDIAPVEGFSEYVRGK